MQYRIGDICKVNSVQEHLLITGFSSVTYGSISAPRVNYIILETGKTDRASFHWLADHTVKVA